MIKPPGLAKGDKIGIVAPAGRVRPERLETGLDALRQMGFQPVLGRHVYDQRGYLAGHDRDRASDLMEMFLSTEIKAIMAARGGYGCMRMVGLLDYEHIIENHKPFVGSSDITFLHLALGQRGLVTFHGPMVEADPERGFPEYDLEALRRALMDPEPLGVVRLPGEGNLVKVLVPGMARGLLVGGNLSLVVSSLGTPYELDTRGRILLLEEVGEAPYRIDRMFHHLAMAGKLDVVAGIVVGDMTGCQSNVPYTLEEVLEDILGSLGKPCITGIPFGHGRYKTTLPLGVEAVLDGDRGVLELVEGALWRGEP